MCGFNTVCVRKYACMHMLDMCVTALGKLYCDSCIHSDIAIALRVDIYNVLVHIYIRTT